MSKKPPWNRPPGYKDGKPISEDWKWRSYLGPRRGWPPWKDGGGAWNMRRRSFKQKPWNKVTRIEKFWSTTNDVTNAVVYNLPAGSNNAEQIVRLTGEALASDQLNTVTGVRGLQHVKVHRIQGHVMAWLDVLDQRHIAGAGVSLAAPAFPETTPQTPVFGNEVVSNIQMCNYVWLKLKSDADTPANPAQLGAPANFNPGPTQDWSNLCERDDILAMGTVPVFGAVVRMYSIQPATGSSAMVIGNAGQYLQNHVAKIPSPRIPKLGLNLRKGEGLALFCSMWPGPGAHISADIDDSVPSRGTVFYPQLRVLCSI